MRLSVTTSLNQPPSTTTCTFFRSLIPNSPPATGALRATTWMPDNTPRYHLVPGRTGSPVSTGTGGVGAAAGTWGSAAATGVCTCAAPAVRTTVTPATKPTTRVIDSVLFRGFQYLSH